MAGLHHDPHGHAPLFTGDPAQLRVPGDPELGPAAERVRYAAVAGEPIDAEDLAGRVVDARCGAVVRFDGVVRDHDEGRGVAALEYEAHPSASEVMAQVCAEMAERWPDVLIAAEHRVGPLAVGESALVCVVSSPHRMQAIAACDELVTRIKERLPIWKRQEFADGTEEWLGALG